MTEVVDDCSLLFLCIAFVKSFVVPSGNYSLSSISAEKEIDTVTGRH